MPLEYSYKRRALGKTDRENFAFYQDNDVSGSSSVQERNGGNIFDKLSVQYQLQLDLVKEEEIKIGESFSYKVRDKGILKDYKFVIENIEKIETELGSLKTIRITRVRKKDTRSTVLWLAQDYKYTLVRMTQRERNKIWKLEIKDWLINRK